MTDKWVGLEDDSEIMNVVIDDEINGIMEKDLAEVDMALMDDEEPEAKFVAAEDDAGKFTYLLYKLIGNSTLLEWRTTQFDWKSTGPNSERSSRRKLQANQDSQ